MIGCAAAFGRLCVETYLYWLQLAQQIPQPPSGGCVLKHKPLLNLDFLKLAAAFGRLCVETTPPRKKFPLALKAAAFGRLCVET